MLTGDGRKVEHHDAHRLAGLVAHCPLVRHRLAHIVLDALWGGRGRGKRGVEGRMCKAACICTYSRACSAKQRSRAVLTSTLANQMGASMRSSSTPGVASLSGYMATLR